MPKDTIKATVSLKAESLGTLLNTLEAITEQAGMSIVSNATVTTSIAIESEDADDLQDALSDVARAVAASEGVEAKISAPATVWHGRRLDPTPMERYINAIEE